MQSSNQFSLSAASAFATGTNYAPWVRSEIKTEFTDDLNWTGKEARLDGVELRAAAAFTVEFNSGASVTALADGDEYVLRFDGDIQYILFAANTTLTAFNCLWSMDRQNHKDAGFNVVAGSTVTLTDDYGHTIPPSPVAGKFELMQGWYKASVTATGYDTLTAKFLYNMEDTVILPPQVAVGG